MLVLGQVWGDFHLLASRGKGSLSHRLHFSNWVRLSGISARADIASLVIFLSLSL